MPITKVKNYAIAPYHDDYDESKNYHRILFRPGFAVQARELTQLQTALQSQIDRVGQYSFNDGSRVVGGKVSIDTERDFIKLTSTTNVAQFVGTTITGGTNGVQADVIEAIAATGGDPDTLYIKYKSSGTGNTTKLFANGESITNGSKTATLASSAATGKGSRVSIEEGVYFISGTMAYVASQSLILDKYTNTPSYIIGLKVTESLVDSSVDNTLVDNAQGTPNFAAPGAHRYQIATQLIKESLTSPNSTHSNYIILMKVNNGVVQVETQDRTANTELTTRLARRTHEESGNYTVTPLSLDVREHLNDEAGNNGFLTAGSGGSATKLAIGVEPAIAYVQGYRLENLATKYVAVDKPRTHVNENRVNTSLPIGNYVKVTLSTVLGMPDINDYKTCELRNNSNTKIGTARIRGFEEFSSSIAKLFLFDIVMDSGQTWSNVNKVFQNNLDANQQDFSATMTSATNNARFDVGQNNLVFKLPFDAVKSLRDSSPVDDLAYQVRVQLEGQVSGTGTSAQVTFSNLPGGLASLSDIFLAVGSNAAVAVPVGAVESAVDAGSLIIKNNSNLISTMASGTPRCQAIATVKKSAAGGLRSKTKTTQSATNFSFDGTNPVPLNQTDVLRINTLTVGGVDFKDKFTLDNGQRDNYYEEARLIPIGSQAAATLSVSFDYYEHGEGDYFSVDSYHNKTLAAQGNATEIAKYEEIPVFNGSNGTVELRDCLDFRPTKSFAGSITTGQEFSTGTGASTNPVDTPKPGSVGIADISHYLGRIDKLYMDREGAFKIISGVADTNPKVPEDVPDSMTIFNLHYQPYVFDKNDLVPVKIDNKRYTMKDIGGLDKRIKNLEYYTSLSLLEKDAQSIQIPDGTDERLKNGIVVDGFFGHNVGNVTHPDYHVSIDKSNGILRPMFYEDNVNLVKTATQHSGMKTGSLVHLPFTETTYIDQPYATTTEFVNPYNVFVWGGDMKLSPESDEWKDTDTRPDVVIDDEGVYDQLVQMADENGILGTVWNEWETNWTGVESSTTTETNWVDEGEGTVWSRLRRRRNRQGFATTSVTATTTTQQQSRSGIRTTVVPDTQLKELGSRVVETNFIPFIRSREIFFKAERLKPNTKMFAFFNGTNVTDFCSETGGYKEWSDETNLVSYRGATVHSANTDLITDASGKVEGSFRIPHNSTLKFKTGTREFRLTDDSSNNKSNESTFAEALYHAQGLLEVKENVIMSTKVPRFVSTELTDERVIEETSITRFTEPVEWVDPLAQTFIVDTVGGIFASSVDLFIAAKDAAIPLNVSIRSVENGIPTQQIVPGSSVNVYPNSGPTMNTSTDGSVAYNIPFDHPIYLGQDQEYAIVLISNSDDYKVFIAETGGFDLQNQANRVTKQPYNGVFFTSQNASTWTPEQTKDLKFKLKRCSFSQTSGTVTLQNDKVPARTLPGNPFNFISNSTNTVIRVNHPNHGMYGSNSKVTLDGVPSGNLNGIAHTHYNTTHTISDVERDSYAITITGQAATSAGILGGGSAITATENKQYTTLVPQIQTLEVPNTGISYSLAGYTGRSVDGSGSGYGSATIGQVLANVSNEFTEPFIIASEPNQDKTGSGKSFTLTATLQGTETLSPILDMNRCSVITVENRTNDAGANSGSTGYNKTSHGRTYVPETTSSGGSELNAYVTKRIDLRNESLALDVFLSVNKPKGASIDLYYKALETGSDADFDSLGWTICQPEEIIPDNDGRLFTEAHYSKQPFANSRFSAFAIKVVLRAQNSAYPPYVKDFRAIASL